ncbi:MAG: murein hydrolase activator EnvC family protein [Leucobacter sp.]
MSPSAVRLERPPSYSRARIALTVVFVLLFGVFASLNSVPAAHADDYPTWEEVEAARADSSSAAAELQRVQDLIVQMEAEVQRTQQIAEEKGQIAYEAQEAYLAKAAEVEELQAQADEAAELAEVSELRAGQWAAQLTRVGGGDPVLKLFADSGNADDVLTSIGVSSRVFLQAQEQMEVATQQRNTAQSLSDQAELMRAELERLSAAAQAAFEEAKAANEAAQVALAEQQELVPELEAMADYLQGITDDLEAEYQEGVQKRLEEELAARNASINWAQISSQGWVRPAGGRITSPYGYSPGYSGHHNGTDFGTGCWAPTVAAGSGTVTYAGWYGGLGYYVQIDHGGGVSTGYAHHYQLMVSAGQWVEVGTLLGYTGDTGYSFGCHLHFQVLTGGGRINPAPFMASRGVWF